MTHSMSGSVSSSSSSDTTMSTARFAPRCTLRRTGRASRTTSSILASTASTTTATPPSVAGHPAIELSQTGDGWFRLTAEWRPTVGSMEVLGRESPRPALGLPVHAFHDVRHRDLLHARLLGLRRILLALRRRRVREELVGHVQDLVDGLRRERVEHFAGSAQPRVDLLGPAAHRLADEGGRLVG